MVSVIFLFWTFTLKSFYDKKPLQYCKVINLQLIKINEKNFKKRNNKLEKKFFSLVLERILSK